MTIPRVADTGSSPVHFNDTPLNVLVTGATGFVGQNLVRALLADGHSVVVLTRRSGPARKLFEGKVLCIESMQDLPFSHALNLVVNLAGARILGPRWTAARKAVLLNSRLSVTRAVVDWIAAAPAPVKPALFLSASAIGYYGIQPLESDAELDESTPPQAIFMSQLCQQWEAAAHVAATHGVRTVAMRFGVVFGQHGGALPMMLLPVRLGFGGRLGSGRQWQSWIHLHDLLRGIAHLWQQSGRAGAMPGGEGAAHHADAINFTAPECPRQLAFSQTAARLLHRPCFMPTPAFPMQCLLGEQADLLLQGQRVVPARLQASGFVFNYPTLQGALEQIL